MLIEKAVSSNLDSLFVMVVGLIVNRYGNSILAALERLIGKSQPPKQRRPDKRRRRSKGARTRVAAL